MTLFWFDVIKSDFGSDCGDLILQFDYFLHHRYHYVHFKLILCFVGVQDFYF